jgi:hemoglobin-like flavoprotein
MRKSIMVRKRKKSWEEKVKLVIGSFNRSKKSNYFVQDFYENLFFLNPKIKDSFINTDFAHQEKALMAGLKFMLDFLDQSNTNARAQVLRLSQSHSQENLNIYPHHYYYWIEALILTIKKHDPSWHNDLGYYWKEVVSYPISFMISQYFLVSKI